MTMLAITIVSRLVPSVCIVANLVASFPELEYTLQLGDVTSVTHTHGHHPRLYSIAYSSCHALVKSDAMVATPATGFVRCLAPWLKWSSSFFSLWCLSHVSFRPITVDWTTASRNSLHHMIERALCYPVCMKFVLKVLHERLPFPGEDHVRIIATASLRCKF